MRLTCMFLLGLSAAPALAADTITLKDGAVIQGAISRYEKGKFTVDEGGKPRIVRTTDVDRRCPSLPAPTPVAFSQHKNTQPPNRNLIPMLKLHAGVSKKVGLPNFSSASASCTIEAELDSSLLQDREGFQIVVQRAYQSCC